jgi:hypothetical protein
MRRRSRIDAVLGLPTVRAELEEFKRLFGLAADHVDAGDAEAHLAAAFQAKAVALRIVAAVRAEPGNATLPDRAIYRYVANVAHQELLGEQAKDDDIILMELGVSLPAGRPPMRRPRARQRLIEELKARPDMPDYRIADRGLQLGVWTSDQAQDPANRQRRIKRIREDAAN